MISTLKNYLYHWDGLNHAISQKIHLLIENDTILAILKFFTEYVGYYKKFPIHFIIIVLIMIVSLGLHKNKMSQEQLKITITRYFQLLSTLVIAILCMAAVVGAAKEIFSLTRPLCTQDFALSNYALEYKNILEKTHNMNRECNLSFPSGHSSYIVAMLTILWSWLKKPFKIIGIFIVVLVILSRIALGMHFLADTVFATLTAVFIATTVKHVMNVFFAKLAQKKLKNSHHVPNNHR